MKSLILLLALAGCQIQSEVADAKKFIELGVNDATTVRYYGVKEYTEGVVCGEWGLGASNLRRFIYASSTTVYLRQAEAADAEWGALCNNTPGKTKALAQARFDSHLATLKTLCRYDRRERINDQYCKAGEDLVANHRRANPTQTVSDFSLD